jgi:glutathione S-transferase
LSRFGGPFLGGAAFTAVDAMYAPVVFRIQTYDLPMQGAAADYVSQMLALPGMQQWYVQALQERDIDQAHEQDVERYSDIISDERQK